MTGQEILELGRMAKARSQERMLKANPQIVEAAKAEAAQEIAALQAANKAQAERIDAFMQDIEAMNAKVAELEKANAELAADRDNWRQQALAEDARANAATETKTRKRKGK